MQNRVGGGVAANRAARIPMVLFLKVYARRPGGLEFLGEHLLDGPHVTIGRGADCSLRLDDPERHLSRVHLNIDADERGWRLQVASRLNAIRVNGQEYGPGAALEVSPGDNIVLGDYEIDIGRPAEPPLDPDATLVRPVAKGGTRLEEPVFRQSGPMAPPESPATPEPVRSMADESVEAPAAGGGKRAFRRLLDWILGGVWFLFAALFALLGVPRIFVHLKAMADRQLDGPEAGQRMLAILLGFALVSASYYAFRAGVRRFRAAPSAPAQEDPARTESPGEDRSSGHR